MGRCHRPRQKNEKKGRLLERGRGKPGRGKGKGGGKKPRPQSRPGANLEGRGQKHVPWTNGNVPTYAYMENEKGKDIRLQYRQVTTKNYRRADI